MLDKAVAEQRFLDAAKLRDDLAALTPPPSHSSWRPDPAYMQDGGSASSSQQVSREGADAAVTRAADAPTSSDCCTNGIHIRMESYHMPEHDSRTPGHAMMRFTFGYRVRITNMSDATVQLIARHWVIENATGPESEVRGTGVVGRQPVLEPGESFEYTSACPLTCKVQPGVRVVGNMRGEYTFVQGDTGMDQFTAEVGRLYFVLPDI
jgi:ApaG protein